MSTTLPSPVNLPAETPVPHVVDWTVIAEVLPCLERRPGRDPLSGDLLPGHVEQMWAERLPCTASPRHDGPHVDVLGRTWGRA